MNKTITSIIVVILTLIGLIWIAQPNAESGKDNKASVSTVGTGALTVEEASNYDFGVISMAAGTVARVFTIKNTGSETVTINKMYTSCMCTTAELTVGGKQFGPYGMPGHGAIPTINQIVNPNEEATVEVVFDPAAHGPAGVGRIVRNITIENSAGRPIELTFSAVVKP